MKGNIAYFLYKLKFVKIRDVLSLLSFVFALPAAMILSWKRKHMWLICERAGEARDNGYWFYKYMLENHPEQDCVYAIQKKGVDYEKVAALGGEIIEFGSFRHWIYYLAAELNISSQKEGKPNAAACHLLEIYGIWKNKRVFLQHGIIKNDLRWLYYPVTKMWMFTTTTKREMAHCKEKYGYPEESIVLTGLCRFDNLNDALTDRKTVFIMPTHRKWLSNPIKDFEKYDAVWEFSRTEYYRAWKDFLTNERLNACIQEKKLNVVFFLHPNLQKYTEYFKNLNENITILSSKDVDLQTMLKKAGLLITDYSSIAFDFAYMKKPLLYYQFDYEKFREGHYQKGYFSYRDDGFGKVCVTAEELVEAFCEITENDMQMPREYLHKAADFFTFTDNKNCERTYQAIMARLSEKKPRDLEYKTEEK